MFLRNFAKFQKGMVKITFIFLLVYYYCYLITQHVRFSKKQQNFFVVKKYKTEKMPISYDTAGIKSQLSVNEVSYTLHVNCLDY